jgi:RHS repeat-associated protein
MRQKVPTDGLVARVRQLAEIGGTGIGGRTTGMGFSIIDGLRQKFTSKERDNETGLDYFLARYYSSTQGRFTSPDEFKGGARELYGLGSGASEKQALAYSDIFSPQSLNKYQYCLNNPLRYLDPDGHDYRIVEETDKDGKKVKRYAWDRDYTYKKGDKNGAPSNHRYSALGR